MTLLRTLVAGVFGLCLLPAAPALSPSLAGDSSIVFHEENVLGTSLELKLQAADPTSAAHAREVTLKEIDRLSAVFSTYTNVSEFMRWQQTRDVPVAVSPDLFAVMSAVEHWHQVTRGAFHPGAELLTRVWRDAARTGVVPDPRALRTASERLQSPFWKLDARTQTAVRLQDVPLTFNALAKGYILDRASAVAASIPGVEGVLLEIGGDLRVRGNVSHEIAITDPKNDAENSKPIAQVEVRATGLATSGGYRRGVTIGGRRYSHIVDPRTGQTAEHIAGVTVLAPEAMDADALSTAFCVLSPEESLAIADQTPGVSCLLVLADGRLMPSKRWPGRVTQVAALGDAAAVAPSSGQDPLELSLAFEIQRVEGGRYQRPYVAAWVEDKDNFPVRTLLLWVLQSEKGQRWIPDLRRWHRGDQVRRLAEDTDLVTTISGATRNPGKYSVVWDGKDDHGVAVKPGTYTVYLEVAREHGTYQLMKHEFELGGKVFTAELKGNDEVKGATVEYRRRSARK